MSNNIVDRADSNWQVSGYKWTLLALAAPTDLLSTAERVGRSVGREIARTNWTHVHLIAHSAGSALIQAACEVIKSNSPSTVVHTTFLDPYVGPFYGGTRKYGTNANWADCYFSIGGWPPYTDEPLNNAYNADVTWLDPNKRTHQVYVSAPHPDDSTPPIAYPCTQARSSHGWAIDFYQGTITNSTHPPYEGLGFPLSKEGAGWPSALTNQAGNVPPRLPSGERCGPSASPFPTSGGAPLLLGSTPQVRSGTGTIAVSGGGFTASSGSPVWILFKLTVTNSINFVAFDAAFPSAPGAAGLLSAYWDTNSIGILDERFSPPGLQHYTLDLPAPINSGEHLLGFQIDTYTNVASSVLVTNVTLGFVGFTEPFSLAATAIVTNGLRVFRLTGPSGYSYSVQASSNLSDWEAIATLVNTNGRVNFFDPSSTNSSHRFYRAAAP